MSMQAILLDTIAVQKERLEGGAVQIARLVQQVADLEKALVAQSLEIDKVVKRYKKTLNFKDEWIEKMRHQRDDARHDATGWQHADKLRDLVGQLSSEIRKEQRKSERAALKLWEQQSEQELDA